MDVKTFERCKKLSKQFTELMQQINPPKGQINWLKMKGGEETRRQIPPILIGVNPTGWALQIPAWVDNNTTIEVRVKTENRGDSVLSGRQHWRSVGQSIQESGQHPWRTPLPGELNSEDPIAESFLLVGFAAPALSEDLELGPAAPSMVGDVPEYLRAQEYVNPVCAFYHS
jgi:hypothetical protein